MTLKIQDLVSLELSAVLDAIVLRCCIGLRTVPPKAGYCVLVSNAILEHLTVLICIFISTHKVGTESLNMRMCLASV